MDNREAIEWLKGCVVAYEVDNKGKPNGNVTCELIQEVIDMAISALKKQKQDRWIPVAESLPEEDCECRVTVKNEFCKYVGDCFWNNGKKQFENWSAYLNCYVKVSDVTAWKPIEEPYKEEES